MAAADPVGLMPDTPETPAAEETYAAGSHASAGDLLTRHTMVKSVHAVCDGTVSVVELVAAALDSLDHWQPITNAASQIWHEDALSAARSSAAEELPLRGIPVLVKEHMDVAGYPSTACCAAFSDRVAGADAELVTRLRRAGAIVVGKANMHEMAASGTNHLSACGPTRNPWDPRRLTGGSSGGSAAAVATRSVPLSLGTDTAGSIRVPSSFCGVSGLKPTQDRLSMHGVMPLAPSFGCPGPIAAGVDDLGLAYAVLADQPEGIDRIHEPARGLRLGRVDHGYYAELIHPVVDQALDHVAGVLAHAGVGIRRVSLDGLEHALSVWGDIAWAEFVAAYPHLDLSRVGHQIAEHYKYGQNISAETSTSARSGAFRIRDAFLTALRDVDALLLPCTAYPAPFFTDRDIDLGDGRTLNVFHGGPVWFTCPINVAGLPALAIPAGFTADGLPVGVQIIGRPGDEWLILRLGSTVQARTDHHRRAPSRGVTSPPPA